ncbi:putative ribosomal N-acetyltransferase YdaF [Micromonospora sp. MH33]|uniref:GNAT family N-acetyltransferase n=1 Tax=Micromonospora sp. MH33 TaxID=1945509 RepID=UPI000D149094|nr:GNAT family protein [Micromonospora sp. MH33]PSK67408.1 putative ribosomal N-acetyltransferase YdaF [Micromonospora sp. MH33]
MRITVAESGAGVPTVTTALFTWPLGDDAVLIPRTAAIAEAHLALVEANYQRLARWFPDAFQEPPTLDGVRANLERAGQAWLEGSLLSLSIAVPAEGGWRLVGWVQLVIDGPARSGEVGYWLDAGHVGRGLVARAVTAVLDHAFGPLGLERVALPTTVDNTRSRSVAERLGFTQEGVLREAAAFPDGRRDLVVYGLLAREWHRATRTLRRADEPIRNREAGGCRRA